MDHLRFDGRVAIVTGAGGNPGLGRAYALLLASRGAKVVVNDLGVGPDGRGAIGGGPEHVVAEIRAGGGEAIANTDSVGDREGAARIVQSAIDTWGRLDIVINNAGIAPFALFDEISDFDIERVVGVHLMGHIWMCRAAWPHMKANNYGRLVNVSSSVSFKGLPYQSIYSAAKMGVVGLTRALAAEGQDHGIRANAIMPNADTLAWQTMMSEDFSAKARARGVVPDVVAPVAAWLAHEQCTMSGKILHTESGGIKEVFFATTAGTPPKPDLSLEDVARDLGTVIDRTHTTYVPDPEKFSDSVYTLTPKPYSADARA
ncbi:SDR family NAD(P)-dependent oxidoreductase [Rhodococcus qingshengii]|uniref:SDR family NAD(P)-dependent oxidoreductase n=1 Tax=Rhodococcus qingshengii TaxID=334542 RepID=UPI0021BAD220|nr:SDR family NAD(P)-dependent oxidoreductase [Rhodococcus qingshengii]UXF67277.1 SDR family NAD(P)-dependent oxidoreductase [Rhodococcus qingshengii]